MICNLFHNTFRLCMISTSPSPPLFLLIFRLFKFYLFSQCVPEGTLGTVQNRTGFREKEVL